MQALASISLDDAEITEIKRLRVLADRLISGGRLDGLVMKDLQLFTERLVTLDAHPNEVLPEDIISALLKVGVSRQSCCQGIQLPLQDLESLLM